MFTPDQAAGLLRRVAARIDASKQPSAELVRRDLQLLASVLVRQQRVERIAHEMLQIAAGDAEIQKELSEWAKEQEEKRKQGETSEDDVSIWDLEEGKALESEMKYTRKQEEPKKLEFALKGLKTEIDHFLTELKRPAGTEKPPKKHDEDVFTSAR
jgi:hypothetical protein